MKKTKPFCTLVVARLSSSEGRGPWGGGKELKRARTKCCKSQDFCFFLLVVVSVRMVLEHNEFERNARVVG